MTYFWWLGYLAYLWLRSRVFPESPTESLGIDPDKPIVYILKARSIKDLFVLDHHCRKAALPRPIDSPLAVRRGGSAGYLYLSKVGLLQQKRLKELPTKLHQLVGQVDRENYGVQIVPVSVFWGRNPGREEKSFFKLLFFDDEHGGILQRFITFFVQGRQVYCHFGKPIDLNSLIQEGLGVEETTKKLRRVLRIHFQRLKTAILGPEIYDRNQVIGRIVRSKAVQQIIGQESKRKGLSQKKLLIRAAKYADEVASRISYPTIRLFDVVLSWVWRKIYNGIVIKNGSSIQQHAQNYELVYMPCHRSHIDYLLVSYVLFSQGLMPPHTVAGINLNFWPIGSLLRRAGAFFIRRTFSGNRLYGAVVAEYIHYLLANGHPLSFYQEGGRSRTGRLLAPKIGILSMVVQSYLRESSRPIMLIPVYIGYDKILESRSYLKELRGSAKQSESMGQLLKARKVLKTSSGKAYIAFGEPLLLADLLAKYVETSGPIKKPPVSLVQQIANEVSIRTNEAVIVTPVCFFALILLAAPKKALLEDDLLNIANKWLELTHRGKLAQHLEMEEETLKDALRLAESLAGIQRFGHPGGDVIYIDEQQGILLQYYRNNILHVFAVPSLIACLFRNSERVTEQEVISRCLLLFPFIEQEFFLRPVDRDHLGHVLSTMVDVGFLKMTSDGVLVAPAVVDASFGAFSTLSRVVGDTIQRLAIYSCLLTKYRPGALVNLDGFEKECQLLIRRTSILEGFSELSGFDKLHLRRFLERMVEEGFVKREAEQLRVDRNLDPLADCFSHGLKSDVYQSLRNRPNYEQYVPGENLL